MLLHEKLILNIRMPFGIKLRSVDYTIPNGIGPEHVRMVNAILIRLLNGLSETDGGLTNPMEENGGLQFGNEDG